MDKLKYKAIIFDLDGVICRTDEYHYKAWKQMADELGIYFDEEINKRLFGVSRMESLEIILEKYDGVMTEQQKAEYAESKNTRYVKYLEEMSPSDLEQQIIDTLNALRDAGVKLAIGSSSKNAEFILQKIGLDNFFDAVSSGNNITKSKPDPEVFIKAAEYIGMNCSDCLVVEDADSGVEAAIRANMDCAAVGEAKKSGKATYNLNSFSELIKIACG